MLSIKLFAGLTLTPNLGVSDVSIPMTTTANNNFDAFNPDSECNGSLDLDEFFCGNEPTPVVIKELMSHDGVNFVVFDKLSYVGEEFYVVKEDDFRKYFGESDIISLGYKLEVKAYESAVAALLKVSPSECRKILKDLETNPDKNNKNIKVLNKAGVLPIWFDELQTLTRQYTIVSENDGDDYLVVHSDGSLKYANKEITIPQYGIKALRMVASLYEEEICNTTIRFDDSSYTIYPTIKIGCTTISPKEAVNIVRALDFFTNK